MIKNYGKCLMVSCCMSLFYVDHLYMHSFIFLFRHAQEQKRNQILINKYGQAIIQVNDNPKTIWTVRQAVGDLIEIVIPN